jgi:hypothetical protein
MNRPIELELTSHSTFWLKSEDVVAAIVSIITKMETSEDYGYNQAIEDLKALIEVSEKDDKIKIYVVDFNDETSLIRAGAIEQMTQPNKAQAAPIRIRPVEDCYVTNIWVHGDDELRCELAAEIQ